MTPAQMFSVRPFWSALVGIGLLALGVAGCTTLREVANLRRVDFVIEQLSEGRLAGVPLSKLRSYENLNASDALRLGASLSDGTLPLAFTLHLQATNPATNDVNARLTEMDWTLLLEDQETVSGTFDQEVVLPPGEPKDVAIEVELDLVQFFDDNLRELVNLAAALQGEGPPQTVKLRVQPTVNTRLGAFKYPSPITVVSKEVGREPAQP